MTLLDFANWVPLPAPVTSAGPLTAGMWSFTDPSGEVWIAKQGVFSGQWRKARDTLYVRGTQNTVTISGLTTIPLVLSSDVYGLLTPANGNIVVPIAGRYQVAGSIAVGAVPNANGPIWQLQRNGVTSQLSQLFNGAGSAQAFTFCMSDAMPCAAGDAIRMCIGNTGGTISANTGCALSVAYLGTG